jgi:hypothetical protein
MAEYILPDSLEKADLRFVCFPCMPYGHHREILFRLLSQHFELCKNEGLQFSISIPSYRFGCEN